MFTSRLNGDGSGRSGFLAMDKGLGTKVTIKVAWRSIHSGRGAPFLCVSLTTGRSPRLFSTLVMQRCFGPSTSSLYWSFRVRPLAVGLNHR